MWESDGLLTLHCESPHFIGQPLQTFLGIGEALGGELVQILRDPSHVVHEFIYDFS